MEFEWDAEKAAANLSEHRVSFEEASTVFGDPLQTSKLDEDHSDDEERWLTTGRSDQQRTIIVWHTDREAKIRIIGARQAAPGERRTYENGE